MVGHRVVERFLELDLAALDQVEEELGVVQNRPAAAELWVLVAKGVQRVRISGHDPAELALLQGGDVRLGQRLEQGLLPRPAHVVAGVALAVVEDPEVDRRRG